MTNSPSSLRVLLHHHGIRAARHGRAGQYPHAFAFANCAGERHARAAFADQPQLRAGLRQVRGPYGKTVADRAVKGRIIAVRDDVFGENAAERLRRTAPRFR